MLTRFWKDFQIEIEKILLKPRSKKTLRKFMVITFGVTIFITTYLLSIPYLAKKIYYKTGDIATDYIRVGKDISYELKDETRKRKEEAYFHSSYIFNRDYNAYKKVVEIADAEFLHLLSIEGNEKLYEKTVEMLPYLKNSKTISEADIVELMRYRGNPQNFTHWVSEYATLIFDNFGIVDKPLESEDELEKAGIRIITESDEKSSEFNWNSDRLIFFKDIFKYKNIIRLSGLGDKNFNSRISQAVRKIVILRVLELYYDNPYTHYDSFETKKRKADAAARISPVSATLKKGFMIARPGDPIDSDKLSQINLLNESQGTTSIKNILGIFIIQLIFSIMISLYIYYFSEFTMRDLASYIILLSLLYFTILWAFFVSRVSLLQNSNIYFALFIPTIFMSVTSGILLGARVTFATGVYLAVFLYYLSGYEIGTLIISIVSALTGIFATVRMIRRSDFFNAAILSSLIISFTVLGIDLSLNKPWHDTKILLTLSFLNSFLSVVLALGILPIYEGLFNIPTRFRLMELSDINNPLLSKLSEEAPSSYSHSLLLASMSEKAVSAINGDTLLTRVGCLYHDIGKVLNAGIYAENKNIEDFGSSSGYRPEDYAGIIIRHVADGIELARQYRLPEKVIAFIPEHHGTSLMQYFYHESLKKYGKTKQNIPDKKIFQYPGPKPQSRETAVVMLADSLEAASRSISSPTRENYLRLIETILKSKLEEGQLDDCNLTMIEIRKIKESFLETLLSTFHLRPRYPSKSKTRQLEKKLIQNKSLKKVENQI